MIITGNCTAGGIVEGLAAALPSVDIQGFPAWELETPEQRTRAAAKIGTADAWLLTPLPENTDIEAAANPREVIDLPNLVFAAFHLDAIYAVRGDGGIFRGITNYHSAIGLWAWRKGLDPEAAARLFTPDIMQRLTYDRYWDPFVTALKQDFAQPSLSFSTFWARLKRSGVFMHTINHPTGPALALLAKAIAVRLGADDTVWDIPTERYTQDLLSHIVWPVYPWVGPSLGVDGAFRWKMDGRVFGTVEDWLEATWVAYEDADRNDATPGHDRYAS